MSTDWYYRFRAPLRPELHGLDLDAIRARAPARFRDVGFPLGPLIEDRMASAPGMGPNTSWPDPGFDGLVGVSTEAGELSLGIWAQNLEREPCEDEDGLTQGAEGTRLDLLLGLQSWATEGRPGDVVGCIASEHDEYDHAHPLVRCEDGLVRMVRTEPTRHHDSLWLDDDEKTVELPARVPCDLVMIQGDSTATLDCVAFRARHLPMDGSLSDPPSPPPRAR